MNKQDKKKTHKNNLFKNKIQPIMHLLENEKQDFFTVIISEGTTRYLS